MKKGSSDLQEKIVSDFNQDKFNCEDNDSKNIINDRFNPNQDTNDDRKLLLSFEMWISKSFEDLNARISAIDDKLDSFYHHFIGKLNHTIETIEHKYHNDYKIINLIHQFDEKLSIIKTSLDDQVVIIKDNFNRTIDNLETNKSILLNNNLVTTIKKYDVTDSNFLLLVVECV